MARRDPAAFAEFVAARSPALFRTAYLMVGDHGLAQDLVQEALTPGPYVAWPRLRESSKAEAYTRKAIRYHLYLPGGDARRSLAPGRRARRRPSEDLLGHGQVVDRAWLWQELRTLPPRQRTAIVPLLRGPQRGADGRGDALRGRHGEEPRWPKDSDGFGSRWAGTSSCSPRPKWRCRDDRDPEGRDARAGGRTGLARVRRRGDRCGRQPPPPPDPDRDRLAAVPRSPWRWPGSPSSSTEPAPQAPTASPPRPQDRSPSARWACDRRRHPLGQADLLRRHDDRGVRADRRRLRLTTRNGGVWFYDGTGSERIGHATHVRLRPTTRAPLVAWVDLAEDSAPQYVVYDTKSRRRRRPAWTTVRHDPPVSRGTRSPGCSPWTTGRPTGGPRTAWSATTWPPARSPSSTPTDRGPGGQAGPVTDIVDGRPRAGSPTVEDDGGSRCWSARRSARTPSRCLPVEQRSLPRREVHRRRGG